MEGVLEKLPAKLVNQYNYGYLDKSILLLIYLPSISGAPERFRELIELTRLEETKVDAFNVLTFILETSPKLMPGMSFDSFVDVLIDFLGVTKLPRCWWELLFQKPIFPQEVLFMMLSRMIDTFEGNRIGAYIECIYDILDCNRSCIINGYEDMCNLFLRMLKLDETIVVKEEFTDLINPDHYHKQLADLFLLFISVAISNKVQCPTLYFKFYFDKILKTRQIDGFKSALSYACVMFAATIGCDNKQALNNRAFDGSLRGKDEEGNLFSHMFYETQKFMNLIRNFNGGDEWSINSICAGMERICLLFDDYSRTIP